MLKKEITYEDFNGDKVVETFYFNLSKTELTELQASGFEQRLKGLVESQDPHKMFIELKELVLKAYGVKSEDGKRFIKSEQLREEFSQSAAFDALFMELTSNEQASQAFMLGVLPSDVKSLAEAQLVPPTPNTSFNPPVVNHTHNLIDQPGSTFNH